MARLGAGKRTACNCASSGPVNGAPFDSVDRNCYMCNIIAGPFKADETRNPYAQVLAAGIRKGRFKPYKTKYIANTSDAWFNCITCGGSTLDAGYGKCISRQECLSASEYYIGPGKLVGVDWPNTMVIYSPGTNGGRCTAPFNCVNKEMNPAPFKGLYEHNKCRCPPIMSVSGCTTCAYTKSWRDPESLEMVAGPVCTGCPKGYLILTKPNGSPAWRNGAGKCVSFADCMSMGGIPNTLGPMGSGLGSGSGSGLQFDGLPPIPLCKFTNEVPELEIPASIFSPV